MPEMWPLPCEVFMAITAAGMRPGSLSLDVRLTATTDGSASGVALPLHCTPVTLKLVADRQLIV